MPGWLVRAVAAADLMRLVALRLSLAPFKPGCAKKIFFSEKKCAELTDARSVFLRARSRPVGSVTRSLESFSPPPLFQGRATGKKILELVARGVLGLLASAIACFSVGVFIV